MDERRGIRSATRLAQRAPWLCVSALRRICPFDGCIRLEDLVGAPLEEIGWISQETFSPRELFDFYGIW